ncbi:MAG: cupin domain-containing protein [Sphaerochaetaceae bacterium]
MFFSYNEKKSIKVPFPFNRVMTPYMTKDTADGPIDFSVHMTEWEPGAEVDEHLHDGATEAMYCLEGEGTASVNDNVYNLKPNTMIAALPGEKHKIRNTGHSKLRVLCIFSPPASATDLKERAEKAVADYNAGKNK